MIVQGASSEEMHLDDTVCQGTVLGPSLWNTFFADVAVPASSGGGHEAIFADDLNVFKAFDRTTPLEEVISDLTDCRRRVHTWGRCNRVAFDANKEHLVIVHPSMHHGESFRLLGCMIDLDLRMNTAIDQFLAKIRPKSLAILSTRGYYSTPELINQYKTISGVWLKCIAEAIFMRHRHCSTK